MAKHYQESEIEFRISFNKDSMDYPVIRGVIVHQYGGTLEECITRAREQLDLDENWKLIRAESA